MLDELDKICDECGEMGSNCECSRCDECCEKEHDCICDDD